jgi:RNA polymerase sigma factor (TIGR02999 family)
MAESQSVTVLLQQFAAGDKTALDRLMPLMYAELRRLADSCLRRERSDHTLQPTALVHEAYLRLIGQDGHDFHGRAHFLGVAARVMRQILVDHARARNAAKRGGGMARCSLDPEMDAAVERPWTVIAINDAIEALEQKDARKAQLVELKFFGGLTHEESADVLELSVDQVRSELRVAQAWLRRELDRGASDRK